MSDETTTPNPAPEGEAALEMSPEASPEALWDTVRTERLRLADELATFSPEQWRTQSQCDAWTVRDVVAHLVTPFQMSTPKFVFTLIKNRTNFDRTMIELTAGTAARYSNDELIDLLRANADNHWTPPGGGPGLLLGEVVVHGQDIRNAIGLANPIPGNTVARTLELTEDPTTAADYKNRIGS